MPRVAVRPRAPAQRRVLRQVPACQAAAAAAAAPPSPPAPAAAAAPPPVHPRLRRPVRPAGRGQKNNRVREEMKDMQ